MSKIDSITLAKLSDFLDDNSNFYVGYIPCYNKQFRRFVNEICNYLSSVNNESRKCSVLVSYLIGVLSGDYVSRNDWLYLASKISTLPLKYREIIFCNGMVLGKFRKIFVSDDCDSNSICNDDIEDGNIFTIDSYNTRVFDDAFRVRKCDNGNYIVDIFIADVDNLGYRSIEIEKFSTLVGVDLNEYHCIPEYFRNKFSLSSGKISKAVMFSFTFDSSFNYVENSFDICFDKNICVSRNYDYESFDNAMKNRNGLDDFCILKNIALKLKNKKLNESINPSVIVNEYMDLVNSSVAKRVYNRDKTLPFFYTSCGRDYIDDIEYKNMSDDEKVFYRRNYYFSFPGNKINSMVTDPLRNMASYYGLKLLAYYEYFNYDVSINNLSYVKEEVNNIIKILNNGIYGVGRVKKLKNSSDFWGSVKSL